MNIAPLHVPLSKPPQAISLTVRALIQRLQAGGVRVPVFQRPLRWRSDDVVMLFDSLLRGYPVGSLLFWRRPAEADPDHRVGNALLPVPANSDAWWIVDGQQRVTALAAGLLDVDHGVDPRWVVRFDPVLHKFLAGPPRNDEIGKVVPLQALGDLRRLGRWLRHSGLDDHAQTVVEEAQQRLLDYELSAYLMETDEPAALQGVFARLNSTGVRMRSDEVFQALLGVDVAERRALDLNRLQACCDLDGFGQPPRGEVLKAVLAMSGEDPTKRPEALGDEAAARLVGASDAAEALGRAVAFLQADPDSAESGAGIPCYNFIPYPVVFVLLARWFHKYPAPEPEIRRALALWLWRGVANATHQRAAVSALRLQVRLITGTSAENDLDALLREVGEPTQVDWSLERFHAHNARSRVEMLAMLKLGPRHPDGPVSWRALVTDGQRVAREIFPSSSWKHLDEADLRLASSAANRALLDTQHTGLRAAFRSWDPDTDKAALESHLIDGRMWESLRQEDAVAPFLRRRATRVQGLVSAFLTERAGLGAPRLRNLESYFDLEPDLWEGEDPFDLDNELYSGDAYDPGD